MKSSSQIIHNQFAKAICTFVQLLNEFPVPLLLLKNIARNVGGKEQSQPADNSCKAALKLIGAGLNAFKPDQAISVSFERIQCKTKKLV
ncbi:hypothetical protein AUC68_04700 [Methyloceanibacter methanicus]|uniref:Uncharacterized protein n=1 Tax=Methyloceanibacter methanicus TaxID=1774968 RepID=A0A1E3W0H4_9HYPH|nr:hypothetical protein AUC68_04700 [Methyloceanibacter methanicus]